MFTYLVDALSVNSAANYLSISGSGGAYSSFIDTSNAVGPIVVTVIVPSGGTNTMTIQPVMNTVASSSGATNVPTAALIVQSAAVGTVYTPGQSGSPGTPGTFATVSTSASVQTLAVVRELCQRYLAVNFTGTSLTQHATVVISFLKQYTL
jgi:hypothetical protein